jgi:MFS family permease
MLMGFANLMMFPLRVEYLANPRFGIALDPQQIALYTITIPSLVRLLLTPLWGWLFDRMNFFVMRILLNIGFAIGTAAFFVGDSVAGLTIGAVVFGAAAAGGELAWSLWTTKFSPPDRVAEYMSVHTFFTGLRGVFAPVVAFQLINALSIAVLGVICAAMIVAASMILLPELKPAK